MRTVARASVAGCATGPRRAVRLSIGGSVTTVAATSWPLIDKVTGRSVMAVEP